MARRERRDFRDQANSNGVVPAPRSSADAIPAGAVAEPALCQVSRSVPIRSAGHAHSPHIWHHAGALGIPLTRPEVLYGTPAIAAETRRLFEETDVRESQVFTMGGHTDGVITFGRTVKEAGTVMLHTLALAFRQGLD